MARRKKKQDNAQDGKKKKKALGAMRIQADFDELELPDNCALTIPNKEDLTHFKVSITSDKGYWKGATYTFTFAIPDNYPHTPPSVKCDYPYPYHPNIDLQGNVCLNLLKEDWSSILAVQQVVHGLIFLFLEPNPSDPLNLEAAEVMRNNQHQFRQNVNTSLAGGYVGKTQFPKMELKHFDIE